MRVLVALVCLCVLAAAIDIKPKSSSSLHRLSTSSRGSTGSSSSHSSHSSSSSSGSKYTCPANAGAAPPNWRVLTFISPAGKPYIPPGAESKVTLDASTKTWKYTDKAYDNYNGDSLKGQTMTDFDLCKLAPKEICHFKPNKKFCDTPVGKPLCCPLKKGEDKKTFGKRTNGGCPSTSQVDGMPRGFMPQVIWNPAKPTENEEKFIAFIKTKPGLASFSIKEAEKAPGLLVPSQDEIFGGDSAKKACEPYTKDNTKKPTGSSFPALPLVCNDNFIYDGHHRVSQAWVCKYIEGCDPSAVAKIKVKVAQADCPTLIKHVQDLIDYKPSGTRLPKAVAAPQGVEFAGFVELEARFGRSAHESVVAARVAFVDQTRQRLADVGLELKGGDEALGKWFDHRHAPYLWA